MAYKKLQLRRGVRTALPSLSEGEMGFCTDTKDIYVGDGSNNYLVGGKSVTNMVKTGSNITVPVSSFVSDATYTDYPYRADFTISGFAGNYTDYVPDVYFAPPWTDNGVLASFCESVSGGIRLYARSLPESAVAVKTVKLIKGV